MGELYTCKDVVDAAKDADRMPPALPGGAKAQIGG